MRVEDYEYNPEGDRYNISEERANELIHKVKDQVKKGFIAHFQILRIGRNDDEYSYIYDWLDENGITIRDTNVSNDEINQISRKEAEEDELYYHIKRIGKEGTPDRLDKHEQEKLFKRLQEFSKEDKQIDKRTGRFKSKDYEEIREKLIRSNMRLVKWVANSKSINNLNIEREDAEQMGYLGLINAVDRYDPSRGTAFSTYAVKAIYRRIISEVMLYNREFGQAIRTNEQLSMIEEIKDSMLNAQEVPTPEIIAEIMGVSLESVKELLDLQRMHEKGSLDEIKHDPKQEATAFNERGQVEINEGVYVDADGVTIISSTLGERYKGNPVTETEINELKETINKVLKTLTPREEALLRYRFGLDGGAPKTLVETGEEFNVSTSRAGQIVAKALRKLRHPRRSKNFITGAGFIGDEYQEDENVL